MNYSDKIKDKIDLINNTINLSDAIDNYALLTGRSGIILYKAYYNKIYNTNYFDIASEISSMFNDISSNIDSFSFCTGVSGISWTYKHLISEGLIDADENALDELDFLIKQFMMNAMHFGNYDYLHGALGAAWFFLESNKQGKYNEPLVKCIEALEKTAIKPDKDSVFWGWTNNEGIKNISNFSLSHGMSSILIFLSECYRQNIEKERCYILLKKAIYHIKKYKRTKPVKNSLYPNTNLKSELKAQSRLAWCYGDLGIAIAFWKVGEDTNNPELQQEAMELTLINSGRRDLKENTTLDALICHGACGLARIFKHFYTKTNNAALKETYLYWIEQTLKFDEKKNDLTGYKAYRTDSPNELLPTLLEGIAGLGLVLMSELTQEKLRWDRCLLLT